MRFIRGACIATALALVLVSCGPEPSGGGGSQMGYKEVKSMVIDILGSQEAQEALTKAQVAKYGASSLHMQALTPQDQEQVRLAVKDVLTSPDYSRVLEEIMMDPKFAGEFAKAVSKDNKQIHKELMKDPTYQKELIGIFKSMEMQKLMFEAMKSAEYRTQMMSAVQEAVQNPIFKLEIMKMLQSVVKEELTPKRLTPQKGGDESGGGGHGEEGEKSEDEGQSDNE